jgi:hypothetical protein
MRSARDRFSLQTGSSFMEVASARSAKLTPFFKPEADGPQKTSGPTYLISPEPG